MTTATNHLGIKRDCPKCAAKFFDMQASPIVCPKCKHSFKPDAPSKPKPPKRAEMVKVKKPVKSLLVDDDDILAPEGFDESADTPVGELEDMDELDNAPEVISLEEVEEHQEDAEVDPNSDDAEEGMFLEDLSSGGELFDDLEVEEELEEDEDEKADDNQEDDGSSSSRSKRKK